MVLAGWSEQNEDYEEIFNQVTKEMLANIGFGESEVTIPMSIKQIAKKIQRAGRRIYMRPPQLSTTVCIGSNGLP